MAGIKGMKSKAEENRKKVVNMWKDYQKTILKLSYKYGYSEEETKDLINRFDRLVEIKKAFYDQKRKAGNFYKEKAAEEMKTNLRLSGDIIDYIIGEKSLNDLLKGENKVEDNDRNEDGDDNRNDL